MLPSHIAANGVEQQSVIPLSPPRCRRRSSSIAHMPLVPAALVWAPVTCFRLFSRALLSETGAVDGSYVLMRSPIDEKATSGSIHQLALLLKVLK